MGNRFFKGKNSSYKSGSSTPTNAGSSSSKMGPQSTPPQLDERPRHQGSILGLSCVEDKLISCSDDNTLVISSATASNGTISQLVGHKRAVNRVVGFEKGLKSGKFMCWSASRDLSLRCVSLPFSSLSLPLCLTSFCSLFSSVVHLFLHFIFLPSFSPPTYVRRGFPVNDDIGTPFVSVGSIHRVMHQDYRGGSLPEHRCHRCQPQRHVRRVFRIT